ncbi:MAG: hypothetical protein KC454_06475 [Flavobacteriales bacterium]|nr:hypothetical protein [Flavobacteriales bacterium]
MKNISFIIIALLIFSCGKNIKSDALLIDKLVQMEDQVQKMNIIQFDRGNGFKADVKSEYSSTKKTKEMELKYSKLSYLVDRMDNIDKQTSSIISVIENYKITLLNNAGEDVKTTRNKDYSTIVWRAYDVNVEGCLPSRLNLTAVKNKAESKISSTYFVKTDGINLSDKGIELRKALNEYRSKLIQLTGAYSWGKREFEINPFDINSFTSSEDFEKQVRNMIESSDVNKKEDTQVLIDLYVGLTNMELMSNSENQAHWISKSFKDAPLISALATLSALEQDILSARALALIHWKSKGTSCGYVFDKIIPLATGPSISYEGEEVKIRVLMAAYDSYNQPNVTTTNAPSDVTYESDGMGIVSITPELGINTIKGTVSIKNKSGIEKTENWEWTINVLPK